MIDREVYEAAERLQVEATALMAVAEELGGNLALAERCIFRFLANYYANASNPFRHVGGNPLGRGARSSPQDEANELHMKDRLERHLDIEIWRYHGKYNPLDWYIVRHDEFVGIIEMKAVNTFRKPAWLNIDKWMALNQQQKELAKRHGIYAYMQPDGELRYIEVAAVDPRNNGLERWIDPLLKRPRQDVMIYIDWDTMLPVA